MHIFNLRNKNDKKNAPNAVQKRQRKMDLKTEKRDTNATIADISFRTVAETLNQEQSYGKTGQITSKPIRNSLR